MSRFSAAMACIPERLQPQNQALAILILNHYWEIVLAGANFGSFHAG